jgi:hypothetical protein
LTIERVINELKIVQSEEKTFEEVFGMVYGVISISVDAGEFEFDKEKAFFISNNPDVESSIEMPLQELIDILKDWQKFIEK